MGTDRLFSLCLRVSSLIALTCVVPCGALELTLDATLCPGGNSTRLVCDINEHRLYVTSPLTHEIFVYDGADALVETIELDGEPGAIALTGNGTLLVSVGRSVREYTTSGDELVTFGFVDDYFVDPHDVEWASDGRVFVADDDDSIKVFDATGAPVSSFAGWGYINSRLDEPVALDFNPVTGELIIADQNNYRLKAFSAGGAFLRAWGSERNEFQLPGSYFRPFGLDIDPSGRIWSLEMIADLVQVYDNGGAFLYSADFGPLAMRGGVDLAVDGERLYVSSPATGCVYVYTIIGGGPPPAGQPFDLTILWTDDAAQLHWRARPGTSGYRIERSIEYDFPPLWTDEIAATTDTFYTDDVSELPGAQYYYRVWSEPTLHRAFDRTADNSRADWPYREALDQPHDAPHHGTHGVDCHSCHFRSLDYPEPMPAWWRSDHICKSCHVETGFAMAIQTHLGSDTLSCSICHNPHYHGEQYARYYIRDENPVGESEHMLFNHATDFIHGAPNYDGICEICHNQTDYYRRDGSGAEHNVGSNCLTCHAHENGFMPTAE